VVIHDVITFGDTAERLLEVTLVVLVGVALGTHWDSRAAVVAAVLFAVVRPAASWLLLAATPTLPVQRWLMGWFGIRGIGSLYYLCYAMNNGLHGAPAHTAAALVVSVIALSILVHGASARPLLSRYEALGQAATQAPQPMQAAASMALSATVLEIGSEFASGALPVETEMKPPA
jgi:NhaP-type Na+/H+ or K+/H+ antiporter